MNNMNVLMILISIMVLQSKQVVHQEALIGIFVNFMIQDIIEIFTQVPAVLIVVLYLMHQPKKMRQAKDLQIMKILHQECKQHV